MKGLLNSILGLVTTLTLANCSEGKFDQPGTQSKTEETSAMSLSGESTSEKVNCESHRVYHDGTRVDTYAQAADNGTGRAWSMVTKPDGRVETRDTGIIAVKDTPDQFGPNAISGTDSARTIGFQIYSRSDSLYQQPYNAKLLIVASPNLILGSGGGASGSALNVISQDYTVCRDLE